MDRQSERIKLISSEDGLTVDPGRESGLSPQEQQHRIKLIMSLYLAGYTLQYNAWDYEGWQELSFFPLNYSYSYRLPIHTQSQLLLDTIQGIPIRRTEEEGK